MERQEYLRHLSEATRASYWSDVVTQLRPMRRAILRGRSRSAPLADTPNEAIALLAATRVALAEQTSEQGREILTMLASSLYSLQSSEGTFRLGLEYFTEEFGQVAEPSQSDRYRVRAWITA